MNYYVKVDKDVNVFVNDINRKGHTTILFVHGWPLSNEAFEYQYNELPKQGFRCIGLDTRGFGNSDKPFDGYDYDRLADDVFEVIKTLQLEDIILVGHSMGGATCVRYMSRHNGHKVAKLILMGAAVPSLTQTTNYPYGLPKEEVTKLVDLSYNDKPQALRSFGDMLLFQYVTQSTDDWFFQLGLKSSSNAAAKCAMTFRDETLFEDMRKVNVPTLILHGIHDKVCLFPLAKVMNEGIRNSKLVPLNYSGHGLFYEEKEKCNDEMIKFIGNHE